MIEGVARIYATVIEAARARRQPSERKVLGGNQHALTHHIFPNDIDYVALGHLHLAQSVDADHIRYSGSPIPLSMAEAVCTHPVAIVDF